MGLAKTKGYDPAFSLRESFDSCALLSATWEQISNAKYERQKPIRCIEVLLRTTLEYATMTRLCNQSKMCHQPLVWSSIVLCQLLSFCELPLFFMEGLRTPTSFSNVIVLFRLWCYLTFVVGAAQPPRAASGNIRGSQAAI